MLSVPEKLVRTILGAHKEKGRRWLGELGECLRYCERRWGLRILDEIRYPLSWHLVVPAVLPNGSEAVLKLGVPSDEMRKEIAALRLYNGNGMARLLDADAGKGILLLERVKPGYSLKEIKDDEEATRIAARVMKKLRISAPGGHASFPSTSDWARGLEKRHRHLAGGTERFPEEMAVKAEQRFRHLHDTLTQPQLLHGDLHHDNVLAAEREPWLAIDPKGVIGEAEYGIIPYLLNHLPSSNRAEITERRIDLFVRELGLDKKRVLDWAYCHAVLSAWWCIEDDTDGAEDALNMARLFDAMKG